MEPNKPILLSKTIWLNAVAGMCLALSAFLPAASEIKAFIDGNAMTLGMIWSVLGMAIRLITKDKISLID